MFSAHLSHPSLGTFRLWGTEDGLRRLDFSGGGPDLVRPGERLSTGPTPPHLSGAVSALREYFEGERTAFDEVPLDLGSLTPFQERVYGRLLEIGYGQVVTYGDLARELGLGSGASRAVGQAVGSNPVAIVIPCHRVVASDGSLHGFGGGLPRKAALLRLEGVEVDGEEASSKVHPGVLRLPL